MTKLRAILFLITTLSLIVFYCTTQHKNEKTPEPVIVSAPDSISAVPSTTTIPPGDAGKMLLPVGKEIDTKDISPQELLAFARTQIGVPYLYASTDPAKGFDCSGFITYVFNHFGISVPRSSVDFTNYGKEVTIEQAQQGDLILFTGTDSTETVVGHMGIVEQPAQAGLTFIHSTSGKAKGVVITEFGDYYRSRFVKVIRVFPDKYFYN